MTGQIPPHLASKISPSLSMFLGIQGTVAEIFCLGAASMLLFEAARHSMWLYMLGASLCPAAVATLYSFMPFRPYRGVFYRRNMRDVEIEDPVVMRLAALFRSSEAKWRLVYTCFRLFIALAVIGIVATLLLSHHVTWSIRRPNSHFFAAMPLCFLSLFGAASIEFSNWGLRTWVKREIEESRS